MKCLFNLLLPKIIKKQILQEVVIDATSHNNSINNRRNNEGDDDEYCIYSSDIIMFSRYNNNRDGNKMEKHISIIHIIISLSLVCKLWLEIIPSLFYPYIHVDSYSQFRQLIQLSTFGVLSNTNTTHSISSSSSTATSSPSTQLNNNYNNNFINRIIQFNKITIHLNDQQLDNSSNNDNIDNNINQQLLKEFLHSLRGCKCLKVHAFNNREDELLKDVAFNQSIRDLQLIGRLPFVEYTRIPKELLHNSNIKSLTIKNGLTDLNGQHLLETLLYNNNYNNNKKDNNEDDEVDESSSSSSSEEEEIDSGINNNHHHGQPRQQHHLDLKYLGLIDNQCDGATVKILSKIMAINHSIKQLNLHQNLIRDGEDLNGFFQVLATNHTLTELDLSSNCLHQQSICELAHALESNTTLKSLNLANNPITDQGGAVLIQSLLMQPRDCGLENLCLGGNHLLRQGFVRVLEEYLFVTRSLKSLDISGTIVKKESWPLCRVILCNVSLEHLDISMTNMKPASLSFLLRHLHHPPFYHHSKIKHLSLLHQPYQSLQTMKLEASQCSKLFNMTIK